MLTLKTLEGHEVVISAKTLVDIVERPQVKQVNMTIEGRERSVEVDMSLYDLVMLDAVSATRNFQEKHPTDPEYSVYVLESTESEECGITKEIIQAHMAMPFEYFPAVIRSEVPGGYPKNVIILVKIEADGEFKNVPVFYDQIESDGVVFINKVIDGARKIRAEEVKVEAEKAAAEAAAKKPEEAKTEATPAAPVAKKVKEAVPA